MDGEVEMLTNRCTACGFADRHHDNCPQLSGSTRPVCPYCGHEESEPWDVMAIEDGASAVFECQGCERTYHVTVSVRVTYETRAKEGGR